MNIPQPNSKPEMQSVFTDLTPEASLMDVRDGTYGIEFGKLKSICSQYGLKYKIHENCVEYYGPKNRMTHLIEKIHFARHGYSYKKY